ncbi:MAG: nucleotidyltransferase domain-containing protein [bacterium]
MDIERLLDNFKEYLLTSDIKGKIAKIILFGSCAKKTNVSSSDIDILIFTLNGKGIERPLMDKAYTFMMEHNAPFEILISSIDSLFFQDYFVYNVLQNGKEVYSMGVPSKAYWFLLVKVQLGQRLATSPILNSTFREVTN